MEMERGKGKGKGKEGFYRGAVGELDNGVMRFGWVIGGG